MPKPFVRNPGVVVYCGDCRDILADLPDQSAHCCVTSPPYYGLRDYGTARWEGGDPTCDHAYSARHQNMNVLGEQYRGGGHKTSERLHVEHCRDVCGKCGSIRVDQQLGLEKTPEEYVDRLVEVFRRVRRVLRDDGTLWLNLGDSYANTGKSGGGEQGKRWQERDGRTEDCKGTFKYAPPGYKPKDLMGIPWRVAFALQADGWYLRSDIIWAKKSCMTESVKDRPTKAHEYIFLLSKKARYYYDAEAIREPDKGKDHPRKVLNGQPSLEPSGGLKSRHRGLQTVEGRDGKGRNKRSVWAVATKPYKGAHFATFPPKLIEPCVLAGCPEGGTVLDPFAGAGTTGLVAMQLQRGFVGIELNESYCRLSAQRLAQQSLFPAEGQPDA